MCASLNTADATSLSSFSALDQAIERLDSGRERWRAVSTAERITLLHMIERRLLSASHELVKQSDAAKGLTPEHTCAGEDWQNTIWVSVRNLALLRLSLEKGEGALPAPAHQRPSGQRVQPVFPRNVWDRLLFMGFSAEVWLQPNANDAPPLLPLPDQPEIALVLGAGNVGSIPIMDTLYKLFVENQVVLLKMNPVNAYLGVLLSDIFKPLSDLGAFELVYGDATTGKYLCEHEKISQLHLTGATSTYDAIVWGPRDAMAENKARGQTQTQKSLSAELGNITPIIVVPGEWTQRELRFQAWNVVSMVTNNASFNCVAGKVLLTSSGWKQRERFLTLIEEYLAQIPPRKAYYPGAHDRDRDFLDAHPEATRVGQPPHDDALPWTLITGLNPNKHDDICFNTEPFCAILSEVPLKSDGAVDFLPQAVDFCNDVLWGNLACSILIAPSSKKQPGVEAAFDESLDELRYGAIAVNHWAGIPYGLSAMPWGAFPGNPQANIQSGHGVVHNALRLSHTQKSVLYGPFTAFPKPPWFVNHKNSALVGQRMAHFDHAPSLIGFLSILWAAVTG